MEAIAVILGVLLVILLAVLIMLVPALILSALIWYMVPFIMAYDTFPVSFGRLLAGVWLALVVFKMAFSRPSVTVKSK